MFKALSKWLDAKDQEAKQEQYDNGYGYAATRILNYKETPHDAEFDVTLFDRGIRDAVRDISNLQSKAKKLEKAEQENESLREIVRKMQTELRQLLEQIPMQALSDTKLPFKIEELPEWANWVAQDANGMWYCYEQEPIAYDSDMFDIPKSDKYEFISSGKPNTEWKDTLQRITPEVSTDLPFKVEDLPPRAPWKWAAQDENGEWFAYEKKPRLGDYDWVEGSPHGKVTLAYTDQPNPNWKDTLCSLT